MNRSRLAIALACASVMSSSGVAAFGQLTEGERKASVGDAPADPGPLATDLSPALKPTAIQAAMRKVADWQTARIIDQPDQTWTFATLYVGLLSASDTLKVPLYREPSARSPSTMTGRLAHARSMPTIRPLANLTYGSTANSQIRMILKLRRSNSTN